MHVVRATSTLILLIAAVFILGRCTNFVGQLNLYAFNRDTNRDRIIDFMVVSNTNATIFSGLTKLVTLPLNNGNYAFSTLGNRNAAFIGDVNGDAYGDVLIGNPGSSTDCPITEDFPQARFCGEAVVYFGGPNGPSASRTLRLSYPDVEHDSDNPQFGFTAGAAGDVNGDGFGDFFVAANTADIGNGETVACVDCGKVFVYYGAPNTSGFRYSRLSNPDLENKFLGFGFSSSFTGDLNNDGYSDLVFGSLDSRNCTAPSEACTGQASVFLGSATGINHRARRTFRYPGTESNPQFGVGMAIGDFNGDGQSDFAIGANESRLTCTTLSGEGCGAVLVYYGSPGWLDPIKETAIADLSETARVAPTPAFNLPNQIIGFPGSTDKEKIDATVLFPNQAYFGFTLAAADINGDGLSDLIVGAPNADYTPPDYEGVDPLPTGSIAGVGLGYVFWGGRETQLGGSRWDLLFRPTITENGSTDNFGMSLSVPGDLNGDRLPDVIIGSPGSSRVLVRLGSPAFPANPQQLLFQPPVPSLLYGRSVH